VVRFVIPAETIETTGRHGIVFHVGLPAQMSGLKSIDNVGFLKQASTGGAAVAWLEGVSIP